MNDWLKVKTFGMPRWAFLTLLVVGITVGLYLRSRRRAMNSTAPEDLPLEDSTDSLMASGDPGLAGVGVVSPPGGVYPVTTPILPEGLTDLVGGLGGTIGELAGVIGQMGTLPAAIEPVAAPAPVTEPVTGGGPPARPQPAAPGPCAGRISYTEYKRRLGEIRDKHGASSPEVNRFRGRWKCTGSYCCPA